MNKIVHINEEGIKYFDNLNVEKFVSFKKCNRNWINYQEKNNEHYNKYYVGQRDICANPCFIQLFDKPFVKFEFLEKKSFLEIKEKIYSLGWDTIDLS